MKVLAFLALTLIPALIIAALLSGLALLPPLRRSLRSNRRARTWATGSFAGLAFLIGFVGLSYWDTVSFVAFCEYALTARGHIWEDGRIVGDYYPDQEFRRDLDQYRSANVKEAWIRHVVPDPLGPDCYTSQAMVCDLVDRFEADCSDVGHTPAWLFLVVGLQAALVSGALVWRIGRPQALSKQSGS